MSFKPISIDNYVAKHLKSNPSENEGHLRKRLKTALMDYENRIKCSCGNELWVIGSAAVRNACFTCITGESHPKDDYEIDSAIKIKESKKGRRHIDDMDPSKIAGIFDDDGYEIISDLIKKPPLCLICINNDNSGEEFLCNLTRHGQAGEKEFICFAFRKK